MLDNIFHITLTAVKHVVNTSGTQHSTEEIDRVKALLEEETIVKDEEKDL